MIKKLELSPLLAALTTVQISSFLQRKGWNVIKQPNESLVVLEGLSPNLNENVSIVLPSRPVFADYKLRIIDAVRMLSQHYQESPDILIQKIVHWDRDILRIRIESPRVNEQLLPLDFASKIIDKYRDFVAFAATTETLPKRFYAKITNAGKDFAGNCMFGHTFVGSFGLTIECPLELVPQLPMLDLPQRRPFTRAVTERIATGYTNITTAVAHEDPSVIVNNHVSGFSGNMCEILTDIYELLDGRSLEQKVIWAPELSPPPHLAEAHAAVHIDRRSYEILKAASAALQTVDDPNEDKIIEGRITRLKSEKPPLNTVEFATASRTIVILWEIERQQPLAIHIELPLDLYRDACDAHKNGRTVRVKGKPKKIGKFWNLLEHHDFEII